MLLNTEPWQVSYFEMRGLLQKERDPETWDGDHCVNEPVLVYLEPQIFLHSLGWQKQLPLLLLEAIIYNLPWHFSPKPHLKQVPHK